MSCNKITAPEFTKEQIAECKGDEVQGVPACIHITAKKRWCCLLGAWVRENGEMIAPVKRTLQSNRMIRQPKIAANKIRPCNEQAFIKDYAITKKRRKNYPAVVSGQLRFVALEDYIERRIDCHKCNEPNCRIWKGCCGWMKLIYESTKCPKRKKQLWQISRIAS